MAREIDQQIEVWAQKMRRALVDYNAKDRKGITRKAANKVAVAARRLRAFNDSKQPHYRYNGNQRITYNPGNLRRSLVVLPRTKGRDSFVGPILARGKGKRATEYGATGQPRDGYYAQMIFGSAAAFKNRVLDPAAQAAKGAVLKLLEAESRKAIIKRGVRRGIKRG
jgi:hypothetical protein